MALATLRTPDDLVCWWAIELRRAAVAAVRTWSRGPEWPLLVVGKILLASFVFHWLGYRLARMGLLFAATEWEGRLGWRKPMLFGISNAMVFAALAKGLASQTLIPRSACAHAAAWGTAVEVGVIKNTRGSEHRI